MRRTNCHQSASIPIHGILLTPVYAGKLSFSHMCLLLCRLTEFLFFLLPAMPQMEVDPPKKDQNNGNPQGLQENKQGNRKRPGDKEERNAGDPTVAAWARWVKGPFRSFMSKSGHTKNIAELTLSLEEDTAEQEIPDGTLEALAVRSGLDISREDLLTALAVYGKRKGLQPDLVEECFVPWGAGAK